MTTKSYTKMAGVAGLIVISISFGFRSPGAFSSVRNATYDTADPHKCDGFISINSEKELPQQPKYGSSDERIFWISPFTMPGDFVLVKGSFIEEAKTIKLISLKSGAVDQRTITTSSMGYSGLNFQIPNDFPSGPAKFTINDNPKLSGTINFPLIQWTLGLGNQVLPDTVGSGDTLDVHGINFPQEGTIILLSGGTVAKQFRFSSVDERRFKVPVPSSLTPGDYKLVVRSQDGSVASSNYSVEIVDKSKSVLPIKIVNCDQLSGDGSTDNYQIITNYLIANSSSNLAIHFKIKPGVFLISQEIHLLPNQYIDGASLKTSKLLFQPSSDDLTPRSWISGIGNFGLSNISIEAPVRFAIISNFLDIPKMSRDPKRALMGNITLSSIECKSSNHSDLFSGKVSPTTLIQLYGRNIIVKNCTFNNTQRTSSQAAPKFTDNIALTLIPVSGCIVSDDSISLGSFGVGMYVMSYKNVVIERNIIAGFSGVPGACSGISMVAAKQIGFSKNLFAEANYISGLSSNDKEAMTTDGGGGSYFGRVSSSSETETILPTPPNFGANNVDFKTQNSVAAIVAGRGVGQYRFVTSVTGNHVILSSPWDLAPDSSSAISIFIPQLNIQLVRNKVEKTGYLQFFGGELNSEISENEIVNSLGISLYSGIYFCSCEPLQDILVKGNRFEGSSVVDSVKTPTYVKNVGIIVMSQSIGTGLISGVALNGNQLGSSYALKILGNTNRSFPILLTKNTSPRTLLFNKPMVQQGSVVKGVHIYN